MYIIKDVYIGDNVFIGANTLILPGTHIEDNCIIGGGSVVKGRVPRDSVVCGNPCKVISTIDSYYYRQVEV